VSDWRHIKVILNANFFPKQIESSVVVGAIFPTLMRRICCRKTRGLHFNVHKVHNRVARCVYFQAKNLHLSKFWSVLCTMKDVGKFYDLLTFRSFYGHLRSVWYIFPVLVCCAKKNLATLVHNASTVNAKCKFS
jgi:hypothetical protein